MSWQGLSRGSSGGRGGLPITGLEAKVTGGAEPWGALAFAGVVKKPRFYYSEPLCVWLGSSEIHLPWPLHKHARPLARDHCDRSIGCPSVRWASLVAQLVKNLPAEQQTWVQCRVGEDPLEKGKDTHSSILAWRIPWTVQYSPWDRKESDTAE